MGRQGIEILILACNEEQVLLGTLAELRPLIGADDTLHVVADHCRDRTAQVAAAAGARVYVRDGASVAGKAQALRYWLDRTSRSSRPDQAVLILDADSSLSHDSLTKVAQLLEAGAVVIQLPVLPRLSSSAPIPRLAAFSETLVRVSDGARARLGWPVRLRGTGMAFRRGVLEVVAEGLHTVVEDLELTLRVVDRGLGIAYAEGAFVLDPKPADELGVIRQRSRWFRGQLTILRDYPGPILRIAGRGPAGWLLLYDALARPKSLWLPLQLLASLAAMAVAASNHSAPWAALGIALLTLVALDVGAYLLGIRNLALRGESLLTLAYLPSYMLAWARSILLAVRSADPWVRVRPVELRAAEPDRQHARESS